MNLLPGRFWYFRLSTFWNHTAIDHTSFATNKPQKSHHRHSQAYHISEIGVKHLSRYLGTLKRRKKLVQDHFLILVGGPNFKNLYIRDTYSHGLILPKQILYTTCFYMICFAGFLPSAELLDVNDTLPSTFHSQMLVILPWNNGTTHANPTAKLPPKTTSPTEIRRDKQGLIKEDWWLIGF